MYMYKMFTNMPPQHKKISHESVAALQSLCKGRDQTIVSPWVQQLVSNETFQDHMQRAQKSVACTLKQLHSSALTTESGQYLVCTAEKSTWLASALGRRFGNCVRNEPGAACAISAQMFYYVPTLQVAILFDTKCKKKKESHSGLYFFLHKSS